MDQTVYCHFFVLNKQYSVLTEPQDYGHLTSTSFVLELALIHDV